MSNRILETITGRRQAEQYVLSWVRGFNEANASKSNPNRMRQGERDLQFVDSEGSGEFVHAVCININEAESVDSEIYQIQTSH
jgi:hypothetical protein